MNILVMCHGNLNRSPACAAVLRECLPHVEHKIISRGFKISANLAAKKMRDAMRTRRYLNLSGHRPTEVNREEADLADMVVLMDGGNRKRWEARFPDLCDDIVMLGDLVGKTRIPDPAYLKRGSIEFEATVDLIVEASMALAKKITS